jgi:transposase-like protein
MVTNTTATAELVDTGETRDQLGRKITPRARRAELVAIWQQSGLTQAAFARREGVRYPTFASWVQQARQTGSQREAPVPKVRFAEVQVPAALGVPAVEVRLGDGTVVRGTSAQAVAAVARALRA